MSDTSAPSAPPPSAPPATETPINTNPPSQPNAVGPQAPQAPVGDLKGSDHRPLSRREAIQAAFDRANKGQEPPKTKPAPKPAPKAAEAKPGHNQPPEPVAEDKPKINLKKRPDDQDPKTLDTQPRTRGEGGRFAPRAPQADAPGQQPSAPGAAKSPGRALQPLPEGTPFRDPPPRMADHAKAEWSAAPASVRGEVHRMEQEFGKAYQAYRDTWQAFQPIARFHNMAAQQGTTLEKALDNYVNIENKLRADVVGGLDVIVNNLNLRSPDGKKLGLRDIAYHVLQQSPEQLKQIQQGNAQHAASQQIGALHNEIAGLKQTLNQWQTEQQFSYTRSQVDQFADSHPRFDELGVLIQAELELGFDLETAYRRAELLKPATQAPQTRTAPPPAAQTRTADRSISGSPGSTGSNPAPRRSEKPVGRREAISNAISRVRGAA
jgi:hypothetical protein